MQPIYLRKTNGVCCMKKHQSCINPVNNGKEKFGYCANFNIDRGDRG